MMHFQSPCVYARSLVGVCLQVLQECIDIPVLGVCLGHQVLGCSAFNNPGEDSVPNFYFFDEHAILVNISWFK